MIKISDWYTTFSDITFPTLFIRLSEEERMAIADNKEGVVKERIWSRLTRALVSIPGAVIVNADCCAQTDSEAFQKRRVLHTPISTWKQLTTSKKVCDALRSGKSDRLCIRPFRRMDHAREFRLFVKDGKLLAASQYELTKNFNKIEKRSDEIWKLMTEFFASEVAPYLEYKDVAIDVYLCSDNRFLVIDMNDWAGETKPLLLRDWNRDLTALLEKENRLLLIGAPTKMGGDVSVSF